MTASKTLWAKFNVEKQEFLLKMVILTIAAILGEFHNIQPAFLKINNNNISIFYLSAFSVRLFSVLRYEVMIHEFDPYFNYRTTKFLADEGFYQFHNWFDDRAWYPLGRIIGGTIYPGLMVTSAIFYHILNFFHISIEVRNVCVFLAPFFSSLTTLVTYKLTTELFSKGAGK